MTHHWAIAGVGRSGTTAVYQRLQSVAASHGEPFRFFYEPYMWGPPTWTADRTQFSRAFARTSAIWPEGMAVHAATPLFLDSAGDQRHDRFVRDLFLNGGHGLGKMIRANGRLRAYLQLVPDLRVILVTRNPIDCVNSFAARFSAFGEEFHPSDYPRMLAELRARGMQIDPAETEAGATAQWWLNMNLWALDAAAEHPDRVLVLPYEAYVRAEDVVFERLCAFLGIRPPAAAAEHPAKPRPASPTLHEGDVQALEPLLDAYFEGLPAASSVPITFDLGEARAEVRARYRRAPPGVFEAAVARDMAPMKLRGRLAAAIRDAERLTDEKAKAEEAVAAAESAAAFWRRLAHETKTAALARPSTEPAPGAIGAIRILREAPSIACVVTSYNNAATLSAALESLRAQSLAPTEVILADDGSTDGSRDLLASLADDMPGASLILRDRNLGPGANRHEAILATSCPFITTLDGDDEFGPGKLAAEWAVLDGRRDSVAFSDLVVVHDHGGRIVSHDNALFATLALREQLSAMINRTMPLPHDMLYARELYLKVGGYDRAAPMYEDWSLKIRLGLADATWAHAPVIGRIYHRRGGGLSAAPRDTHAFWMTYCLARNAPALRERLGEAAVLKALRRAASRHASESSRTAALALLPGGEGAPIETSVDAMCPGSDLIEPELRPLLAHLWRAATVGG